MELLNSLTTDFIIKVMTATFLIGFVMMAIIGLVAGVVFGVIGIIRLLQRYFHVEQSWR